MNKRLAKLQKELDISDTHNMPSTDIILKNVNNKINVSPEERKIYMKRKYIEYKIAEYPQMTDKGLAWIVLYRIEYID